MPATEPEDVASARALRASPVAPTVAFAVLGLVTVFAVGSLGLSQRPSDARDDVPPVVALAAPHLALSGPPGQAPAAVPSSLRLVPAGTPVAGSSAPGSDSVVSAGVPHRAGDGGDTRAPAGSARGDGDRSRRGGSLEGVVVVGGGGGVAAELPGDGGPGAPVKQPVDVLTVPPGQGKPPGSTPKPGATPRPSPSPTPLPSPSPTPASTPTPAPVAGPTPAPASGPTPAPAQSQAPSQDPGTAPVADTPSSSAVPSPPGFSAGRADRGRSSDQSHRTHGEHAKEQERGRDRGHAQDDEHGRDSHPDHDTDRTDSGQHASSS